MDQCTHEVRAEYWKGIIEACLNRPAGQSAKNWLDENGISEQSYYHWQRKFRKQTYEVMKKETPVAVAVSETEAQEVAFVEIPCRPNHTSMIQENSPTTPVAVIQNGSVKIEIMNGISESLLSQILKVLTHA